MEYTIGSHFEIAKKRIAASFGVDIEKGGQEVPIGTKREWGGRQMMKTADGWVPVGKGTGEKAKQHIEDAKPAMGGGAKVGPGSKITNKKEKVTGTVSHQDDTHTHIEWKDNEGKKKVSPVKHDDLHEKIQSGEYEHHIQAKDAYEASGAADKEKMSDPKEITDVDSAFSQMDNYFKGDEEAERTLKFLKDTIGKDSNVRIDTGMKFDDDRILGLSYPDGRIGVNIDSPYARDKESVYRTLMHEMVHAATRDEMKNSEVLQDEFNGVLSEVRKHLGLADDDNLAQALYNRGDIAEDKYGTTNQYEMVAEVFTNPKFTELLKSIPYKKSNLLHRVMTSIFAAFGGTAKKVQGAKKDLKGVDNMADYLVGLTEKVFKPEPKKAGKVVKMGKSEDKAAAKVAGKDGAMPKMAVGGDGKLTDKDADVHMPKEMKGLASGSTIDCQNGQKAKIVDIKGGKVTYQIDGSKGEKKADLADVAKYIQSGWWKTGKDEIKKSEDNMDTLEKGREVYPLGHIKKQGTVMMIKTVDGWKYHGKGTTATPAAAKPEVKQPGHVAPASLEKEEVLAENPKVNINERFQAATRFTKAVARGAAKCAILYGTGGVGKTYGVTHTLEHEGLKPFDEEKHQPANQVPADADGEGEGEPVEKKDDKEVMSSDYDYVKITGKMTGPQVYKTLYEHNGKILLFDDCDSVLRDSGAINLFKGALDSSGDGTVSWATTTGVKDESGAKLPKRFKFTGKAIFISNLSAAEVPQPIKSRALRVDLSMSPEQTIERLKFIAKNKEGKYQNLHFKGIKKYSHEDMKDIIDYLDKHKHNTSDLNVRTVGSLLSIKQIADEEGIDWKQDADHMIFSKSEAMNYDGSSIQKAREAQIMKSYANVKTPVKIEKSSDVKSLEYRDGGEEEKKIATEKAMGTGNTPGAEYVEKSLSDAYAALGL